MNDGTNRLFLGEAAGVATMAIRIRRVKGVLVALCAAETVAVSGDIYLDDEIHMALTLKFGRDHPSLGIHGTENAALALSQIDSATLADKKDWLLELESEILV